MAVSFNTVVSFNSTLQTNNHSKRKAHVGFAPLSTNFTQFGELPGISRLRHNHSICLSVGNSDKVYIDTKEKEDSRSTEGSVSSGQLDSDPSPAVSEVANGNGNGNGNGSTQESTVKKTPLTVKEKLRAARVLSRYGAPVPKPNRAKLGSSVLDALKESDKGKKSGLPEAPTNLLDDSKRGMPKAGLTFDLPGGQDLLIIAFSFVFISTAMFATTYLVWKLGAIHFNED